MISKQRVGAATHAHEIVKLAGIGDTFAFTPEIRVHPAFLGQRRS
jgi:hypothetical protein